MSASHSTRVAQSPGKGNGVPRPQPAALTVRPSAAGDLVPLCFFFDTVLRKDYFLRRGQLEDILKGRHHKVFVAEIDGILVGVAILTRGTRLLNALVHPAYRGLGIGKELVSQSGAREVRAKLDMSTGDPRRMSGSSGRGRVLASVWKPPRRQERQGRRERQSVRGLSDATIP